MQTPTAVSAFAIITIRSYNQKRDNSQQRKMGLILFILSVIVSIGLAVWFYLPNNVLGDGVVKFTDNAQTRAQTQAVNRGIAMWTNANPDIMFERVEDGFELEIIFTDLPWDTDYVGLYCERGCDESDYDGVLENYTSGGGGWSRGNPEILVDTGLLYCINGYTVNNMANTVAHEIGHLFGLDHHPAPWHLLYGGERGHALFGAAPAEFDDLGFNIPNRLPYWECL